MPVQLSVVSLQLRWFEAHINNDRRCISTHTFIMCMMTQFYKGLRAAANVKHSNGKVGLEGETKEMNMWFQK